MTSLPQRKSPRLHGYDYAQNGAYFVTVCTHQRAHLFGHITGGEMVLNAAGHIAAEVWYAIPQHFPQVELDAYVVMPNHVHGIVVIVGATDRSPAPTRRQNTAGDTCVAPTGGPRRGSLGAVVGQYKSTVTRNLRTLPDAPDYSVWQRGYHDHIIRSERGLNYIRQYVLANPARWGEDIFYESV